MLKPFPKRVQSTLVFIQGTIEWMKERHAAIEMAREQIPIWEGTLDEFAFNYQLTDDKTEIMFKGFEYTEPVSEVTGVKRLKYHNDKPYEKKVPYFNTYAPKSKVKIPEHIILGGQCSKVIERLDANNIEYTVIEEAVTKDVLATRVQSYQNGDKPYEGHFLHNKVEVDYVEKKVNLKPGDLMIPVRQKGFRFLMSVLTPDNPDSYFAWNFFDSYVQQKEYFSPYVFEDKASEILAENPTLKAEFHRKQDQDKDFRESSWEQLYFIYRNSDYYEPSHNFLPIYFSD